jgi:cysteinyl-tRNA synthetase
MGMPLRLYNTLTKREEDFVPLDAQGKVVTMYTCGPTVYGRPHVGNYASFLMADLLRRWLQEGHGYTVRHVKNITDVGHLLHDSDTGDDKIQKEAEQQKTKHAKQVSGIVTREDVLGVVEKYAQQYIEDEKELNFLEPEARPRASAYIKEQLVLTKKLLHSGHAYELPDGIYFSVESKTPTPYGTLSGNTLDQISAGARVEVHAGKKHPADFALWKRCIGQNGKHILRWFEATGEVSHTSGEDKDSGFPGWHIECSAMSSCILGSQIDLHTGGEDNIFPHHECEIAQSESALGVRPFVRTWVHRRRIQMGAEKMSKSLGNVLTIPDIVAQGFSPLDIRYYLLSVHYRTNLKFSMKGLEDAKLARKKIIEWMSVVEHAKPAKSSAGHLVLKEMQVFTNDMDSDLNVSAAISQIFACMNFYYAHPSADEHELGDYKKFIARIRSTFGCFDPEAEYVSAEALQLARDRDAARASKDFAGSDRLRDELTAMGYEVRDTKEGTLVKRKQ